MKTMIINGAAVAGFAFAITFLVRFLFKFVNAPVKLNQESQEKIRAQTERLKPKLTILFDPADENYMKKKLDKHGLSIYVQVRPRSEIRLRNCIGKIVNISRLEDGQWKRTSFTAGGNMHWDIYGANPTTIDPGVAPYLQVLAISPNNTADIVAYANPMEKEKLFVTGQTYKIEFSINYDDGDPVRRELEFRLGENWEKPDIRMLR